MPSGVQYPGIREWFSDRRSWFGGRFQDYSDDLARENPAIEEFLSRDTADQSRS